MASIPNPIRKWIEQFTSNEGFFSSSSDVNHDQTEGGTDGNPHADSAAVSDVSPIQSSGDVSIGDTSTSASSGTVPKSQGDGTVAMEPEQTGTTVTSIAPTEATSGEEPSASDNGLAFSGNGGVYAPNASVLIGNGINEGVGGSVAIGDSVNVDYISNVSVGELSEASTTAFSDTPGVAIGASAKVKSVSGSTAIGANAEVDAADGSIALGAGAVVTTNQTMRVNLGSNNPVVEVDGNGNMKITGTVTENASL